MRVAYFTQWWPPEPANVVAALARELSSRGHDLQVVTGFPNYPTGRVYPGYRVVWRQIEQYEGCEVTRVPLYTAHDRSAVRRFANYGSFAASAVTIGLAHLRRPEVAYVYHPPMTSAWPARVLRRLRGVPFVLHVQDLWPESVMSSGMIGGHKAVAAERLLRRMCERTFAAAAHIVVISPGFKDNLVARGVPAGKVSVVWNWADEDVFAPANPTPEARAELGPADARIVLYAGNLGDYQGLDAAVRAAARVGRDSRLRLVLIGDGLARERLARLGASLGAPNISILPPRPVHEMPRLQAAADALLISLADLPFLSATVPGKSQVALASAKFVIMGVRGDAATLIESAGAGLVCAPTEAGFAEAFTRFGRLSMDAVERAGMAGRGYYEANMSLRAGAGRIEELLAGARRP